MKLISICVCLCLALLLASHLTMFFTFIAAYTTQNKAVRVTINEYGEANLELVLHIITTILALVMVPYIVKRERDIYGQKTMLG